MIRIDQSMISRPGTEKHIKRALQYMDILVACGQGGE